MLLEYTQSEKSRFETYMDATETHPCLGRLSSWRAGGETEDGICRVLHSMTRRFN